MAGYQMFTPEEGFRFVEETLGVASARDRIVSDRRRFLDDVITSLQGHIPFTNLNLMKDPVEKRRRPELDEIKADVLRGIGGLCYNINVTTFYLLKSLGFQASVAPATIMNPRGHVVVYVTGVEKPGDRFLVEVGFGYPTFRAISLDFDQESPVFADSFLEYKYVKRDGEVWRLHGKGDQGARPGTPSHLKVYVDGWRRAYAAVQEGTTDVTALYKNFDTVFEVPSHTPFHHVFRLVQFPDKRAVIISNEKLIMETEEGTLETTLIEGGDEAILQTVKRYFPNIPDEMARDALKNWRETLKP